MRYDTTYVALQFHDIGCSSYDFTGTTFSKRVQYHEWPSPQASSHQYHQAVGIEIT